MKMEIHFAKVMARSEELYKQKLRARKIINRLTREKSRILDTLAGLESEHLKLDDDDDDDFENGKTSNDNSNGSNKQYSIFPEKADIFTDERIWNDDVKYLAQVQSESYEFSSDEENDPAPRNPMSLIEWLRRNQPSVFTIDSGAGADGKLGADATSATAAAGGSGASSSAGGAGGAGSKKRKANNSDAGLGTKPGRKRKAAAAAAAAASSSASSPAPATTTTSAADPAIVAPAAAVVVGDEGAGSTADPSNGSLAPVKAEG
ncbi:hypothetical protein D0Z00_001573 [Geotrichum galactomycetum]|uniref:Uncharacterized protein n=1 Tax=Geotrichum galactomycetum TaxID=27317 RepID=A0ACB6V6J7_9ASCO|nr:hypothetical protein D0Z00_001573 [Geotrichum candidum]